MKYRIARQEIIKDKNIMEGYGVREISRLTGFSPSYVSRIKRGEVIASEKFYTTLKNKLLTK